MTSSYMKRVFLFALLSLPIAAIQVGPHSAAQPAAAPQSRSVASATSSVPKCHVPVNPPSAATTRAVQAKLASYGYTIVIDGIYKSQTTRAVCHWQRANSLVEDGYAGLITLGSLGLSGANPAPAPQDSSSNPAPAPEPGANPASAVPDSPPPVFTGDVPALIRQIWPDDTEEWAVKIAWRESGWQPGVRNACCYGLFQIHFRANRAVLGELGITSAVQLLDAETNIRAALAIFQRSGESPWLCRGHCTDIPL